MTRATQITPEASASTPGDKFSSGITLQSACSVVSAASVAVLAAVFLSVR